VLVPLATYRLHIIYRIAMKIAHGNFLLFEQVQRYTSITLIRCRRTRFPMSWP